MWAPTAELTLYARPYFGGSLKRGKLEFACHCNGIGPVGSMFMYNGVIDPKLNVRCDICYYEFVRARKPLFEDWTRKFVVHCHKQAPRRAAYALLSCANWLPFPTEIVQLIARLVIDSWTDVNAWVDLNDAYIEEYIERNWSSNQVETHRQLKRLAF